MRVRNRRNNWIWLVVTAALFLSACKSKPTARPETDQTRPSHATTESVPQIGGREVITLARKATSNGSRPEFLSLTLLPGRGMNVFQITANLPGKGAIPLLNSPSLEEAANRLSGTGRDRFGSASVSLGGAFLIPYPNRVLGEPSSDGQSITASWRGHMLALPVASGGARKYAIHGLILNAKAEDLRMQSTANGETETGIIHAGDFGGHWVSDTDLLFTIALTGSAVDVAITAKNVGNEIEPMAIGWHPYFVILSGDRSQARLHVPAAMIAVANDAIPSGELKAVKGTEYDYQPADGVPLDDRALDTNFSHFKRTDGAIDVRLADPKSNYGIRVEGISPEIKTVQIYSPQGKSFVAIEDQFNYVDPFGKQWRGMDTGMVTLRPRQSVTWNVRLEFFTPGEAN